MHAENLDARDSDRVADARCHDAHDDARAVHADASSANARDRQGDDDASIEDVIDCDAEAVASVAGARECFAVADALAAGGEEHDGAAMEWDEDTKELLTHADAVLAAEVASIVGATAPCGRADAQDSEPDALPAHADAPVVGADARYGSAGESKAYANARVSDDDAWTGDDDDSITESGESTGDANALVAAAGAQESPSCGASASWSAVPPVGDSRATHLVPGSGRCPARGAAIRTVEPRASSRTGSASTPPGSESRGDKS